MTDDEGKTRAWPTEDQMEKLCNSKIVVTALKAKYLAHIGWHREHPDAPDCPEAHQYWAIVGESKKAQLRTITSETTESEMDIAGEDALAPMKQNVIASPSSKLPMQPLATLPERVAVGASAAVGSSDAVGTREIEGGGGGEKKQLDKAERAAELKASRDAAARDPLVQKQVWLKGAANLISKVKDKQVEAAAAPLPNKLNQTYAAKFEDAQEELKTVREFLEDPRKASQIKGKLMKAKQYVEQVSKDIKAFDALVQTYK
jgi:hypothetical protein